LSTSLDIGALRPRVAFFWLAVTHDNTLSLAKKGMTLDRVLPTKSQLRELEMEVVTKHKEQGNEFIKQQNYDQAIQAYTDAITALSELGIPAENPGHLLYSNRSLAYFKKQLWRESLKDAKTSVELSPIWVKGWIRAGEAYWALERYKESVNAFSKALELEPENENVISLYAKYNKLYIERYFKPLTRNMDIEVRYINRVRGRGVFALRDFFEKEIVYLERPLLSIRNVDMSKEAIQTCAYTLKSIIPPEDWQAPWDDAVKSYMEKHNISKDTWKYCPHCKDDALCGEKYFSEQAQNKAWEEYHQILCTKNNPDHPIISLTLKCRAMEKTNPLFILRIMATMVQRVKDFTAADPSKERQQVVAEAMEPFSMFISNQEPGPLEEEAVECLRWIVGDNSFDDVVNLHTYRELNGAILRNAQELFPVSDLHVYLNSLAPSRQQEFVDRWPETEIKSPLDFVESKYMTDKCIKGTGMFLIANSTNHSCSPNVASTSSTNNYHVTMIAKKNIKKGEELTISYINEQMSFSDRQEKLKQMYLFECKCEKCKYRW